MSRATSPCQRDTSLDSIQTAPSIVKQTIIYKDNVKHGIYKCFYDNKTLALDGEFRYGEKHGYWTWYYKNKKLKFFKTHNSLCSINGNAFTNSNNTVGTIYIVRDPRDIIISASKYYNKSHNETKENMFNRHMDLINKYNDKPISTFLGSWSDHYNSWTKNTKDILLLKYEDLINNKEVEIRKILNFINKFAKLSVDENKIKNCIETSSFKNMKIMENKGLFKENSKDLNGNLITFFNNGKNGNWRGQLEEKIVKEIEDNFQKEMKELGYID